MKEENIERLRRMRRAHFYYGGIGLILFAIILGIITMLSHLGVMQVSSDWIFALLWGIGDYIFFGIYFLWLAREIKKIIES